jgi:NAD-dependent deacetylase
LRQDDVGDYATVIPKEAGKYIQDNFKKGKVVCLSGAGISAESGVPTFRGKGGLWEKYDPEIYAHTEGLVSLFRTHPEKIADFLIDFYAVLLEARPNFAHLALGVLEKNNILTSVITQNVDNLHQSAGSRNVIELHGNAFRIRCMRCSKTITLEKERTKEMLELLKINRNSHLGLLRVLSRYFPRCICQGRYRIDIVLFGEELAQDELSRAKQHLDNCNTLLVVGSSLVVYPAAGLPLYAKERGVKLIEINNEPSSLSHLCDYKIIGQASRILPEILSVLGYA